MKKIVIMLLSFFILFSNTCFGSNLIDNYYSDGAFKFSEKQEGKLPYLAISMDRMIVDRNVNKSGLMISGKNIDVDNAMINNQMIISQDTVRINNSMENAIVFAPKVIVNGNVKHLYAFTENLTISKDANILEDIIILAENLNLDGNVNGSVIGNVANVNVNGIIKNDLRIYTNSINIDNANINGKVLIKSYNDIAIPAKFNNNEFIKLKKVKNKLNINIISIIITYITLGIIYYFINKKNNKIDNMVSDFKLNFNRIILSGSIIFMILPLVVMISLYMMILGIKIVPIILLTIYFGVFICGFSLSSFIIALLLDKKVFTKYEEMYKNSFNKIVTVIVTSIVVNLTIYIPFLGGILAMLYGIITVGLLYINLFNKKVIKE